MPPLSFCYWRCYTSEPVSLRRLVKVYAGTPEAVLMHGADLINVAGGASSTEQIGVAAGISPGGCSSVDDMFYW